MVANGRHVWCSVQVTANFLVTMSPFFYRITAKSLQKFLIEMINKDSSDFWLICYKRKGIWHRGTRVSI